jgi:hypothetical protein
VELDSVCEAVTNGSAVKRRTDKPTSQSEGYKEELRVLGKTIAFKLAGFRAGLSFPSDFLWPTKKVRQHDATKESKTTLSRNQTNSKSSIHIYPTNH